MTTLKNTHHSLSLLWLLVFLSACNSNGFSVDATFTNTRDIETGTPVFLDDKVIGEVSKVESVGNGTKVTISLDKQIAMSLGSSSAVVVNRLKEGAPLEVHNRIASDNSMLTDGQTIKGLDSMFQLGAWMIGDAIQIGSGTVSQYVESFQNYLQSDKFQQDKQVMQTQIESATTVAQEAIQNVERELSITAEELTTADGAAAQALEQLGEEIAPIVQDLASSGALLIEQLEELTNKLEQTKPEQQQAGEQFLASLLATLEKLNQSIEQDADSADDSKVEPGAEKQ